MEHLLLCLAALVGGLFLSTVGAKVATSAENNSDNFYSSYSDDHNESHSDA
jgi:hypothetical protein